MADPCIKIISAFEGFVEEYGGEELVIKYRKMTKDQKLVLAEEMLGNTEKGIQQAQLAASARAYWEDYFTEQAKKPMPKRIFEKYRKPRKKHPYQYIYSDIMSGGGVRSGGMISLERLHEGIFQQFTARLYKGMEKYQPRKLGLAHSHAAQRAIIRELSGISTGDKDAAQFASIYSEAVEYLRKLFNNAGGDIPSLDIYHLPQYHDATRIGRVSRDEWVNFIKDRIHKDKIVFQDATTPRQVSEKEVIHTLNRVYDNLKSRGVIHKELGINVYARRALSKHHQEHRILHFKDPDAWMEYADRFGASDYVQSIYAHADLLSREIAAMQRFGPNPDMAVKQLRMMIQKETGDRNAGALGENIYDQIMGRMYTNNTRLADTMRFIRNVSVGLKIGKAVISAVSDLAFFGMTNWYRGMPVWRGYMGILKGLTHSKEHRMLAAHMVLGARYAIDNAASAFRISEVMGVGGSARFADFMVKASGLNFWTNTVRQTYGLNSLHHLGTLVNRPYKNLHPKVRKMFNDYGISSSDWDRIRRVPLYEQSGARYLNPGAMESDTLTHKITGMIGEETDFAVPEPMAKTLTILRGGSQPGTIGGELARGVGMFKSFATSVILTHWLRAMNMGGPSRMRYLASLLTGTTVLGAIAIQGKQIVDGKTPMDSNRAFWAAAFLQGGGTGILGDFLFQDHTRVGSVAEFILGPIAADATIVLGLALGSSSDFAQARDDIWTKFGARGGKAIDKLLPNLWQTNIILRRYMTDQIQELINPNWSKQNRAMRKRLKERGQKQYWPSGKLTPRL